MTGVNTIGDNDRMDTLHERLRHIRKKAGHPSARSAAIRYGWSPSTYAAHENGQNSFDAEVALRYATAFKADPSWLLFGKEGLPEANTAGFVFKIVGYIKEKGEVDYIPRHSPRSLETVVLFTPLYTDAFIFRVLDDSLWPRYDKNDLVIGRPAAISGEFESYFSVDCIAIMEDGTAMLRQIQKTPVTNIYDLVSFNSPPVRGVKIVPSLMVNAVIKAPGYVLRPGSEAGYRP